MKICSLFTIFGIAIATVLSGCSSATSRPSVSVPTTTIHIPSLKVVLECGTCQVRTSVPTRIVDAYNSAALKSGAKIAPKAEAIITIKEYSERGDGARALAGAFAGKDEIRAVVSYEEKQFAVEDYYRTAWLGIEDLAKNIGEMAFEGLK